MLVPQHIRQTGDALQASVPFRGQDFLRDVGKPLRPGCSAVHHGQKESRLLIVDKVSGFKFLVDTGAEVSVLPHTGKEKPQALKLYAANNSTIDTFGEARLDLDFGFARTYQWNFCIAAVSHPILGTDFLAHYGLLPDLKHKTLVDGRDASAPGRLQRVAPVSISAIDRTSPYADLLRSFPEITGTTRLAGPGATNVKHHILTKGPPVAARVRKLNNEKYKAAKAEIDLLP